MQTTIAVAVDGQTGPSVTTPETTIHFFQRVANVEPDGRFRTHFEVQDVSVEDNGTPQVSAMRRQLASLGELRGSSLLDARGNTLEAELEIPENSSALLRNTMQSVEDAIRQMSPPLPVEAVGVGARWRTTSTIQSGVEMSVVSDYEVTAIEGDVVSLATRTEVQASAQEIESGHPNVTATLERMTGSGDGTCTLRLDRVAAEFQTSSHIETHTRITQAEGASQSIETAMDIVSEVSEVSAEHP